MVPDLRFSNNCWHCEVIGDSFTLLKGTGLSKSDISNNGIKCILYGHLYTTYLTEVIDEVIYKTNAKIKNPIFSKKNDVIIPASGETSEDIATACCIKENNILLGGDLNILRSKAHDGAFTSYQLNGKRKYDIAKLAVGKSIVHLHNEQLKKLKLYYPFDISEEIKISTFLNKIDKRISTQKKIIKDYETLKIKICNKIYNKKIGKRVKLSSILTERNIYSEKNNGYIHATLSKDGLFPKTERYNRDFLVRDENKGYKITKLNDLCYNPANLKFGVICLNKYGDAIFSPIYVTFEIDKNTNPDYVAMMLTNNKFINKIRKYEQGTVYERMSVNPKDFMKGEIFLPNLEIQSDIMNKINIIINKIETERKILSLYEKQKQYLLDHMFI